MPQLLHHTIVSLLHLHKGRCGSRLQLGCFPLRHVACRSLALSCLPAFLPRHPNLSPFPSPLRPTFTAGSVPCRHQQSGVPPAFPGGPSMQGHLHLRGVQQTRPVELSSYGDGLLLGAGLLLHLLNQTAWFKLTDLSSLVVQRQQLEYKGAGEAANSGDQKRALLVLCKAACVCLIFAVVIEHHLSLWQTSNIKSS